MGKKKNAAKKGKHLDSQGAGNGKAPDRPEEIKNQPDGHSKVSKSSHTSQSSQRGLNKAQTTSSQQKTNTQKSSTCFWIVVVLLATGVAVPAVVFREEIGDVLDPVLEEFVRPQILNLKERFMSSFGEDQGSPQNIPPDEKSFEDLNVEPAGDTLDDSKSSQQEEINQPIVEDEKKIEETIRKNTDRKNTEDSRQQKVDQARSAPSTENEARSVPSPESEAGSVPSKQNSKEELSQRSKRDENIVKTSDTGSGRDPESRGLNLEDRGKQQEDKTVKKVQEKVEEKTQDQPSKPDGKQAGKGREEENNGKNTDKKKQSDTTKDTISNKENQKSAVNDDRKKEEVKAVPEKPVVEAVKVTPEPSKTSPPKESTEKNKPEDRKGKKEKQESDGKNKVDNVKKDKDELIKETVERDEPKVEKGQVPKDQKPKKDEKNIKENTRDKEVKRDQLKDAQRDEKKEGKEKEKASANLQSDKKEKEDRSTYVHSSITNDEDFKIRHLLDEADMLLEKDDLESAVEKYDIILRKHVASPRAHYGKGLTLDKLGFKYMSNEYLEQAIDFLARVIQLPNVPDGLVKLGGRKLADRQQFRGWGVQAMKTFKFLSQKFPEDLKLLNDFGVSYMMIGQDDRAKDVFKQVLAKDPNNGFAKAHLGFILKTRDSDLELAVKLLMEGIRSGDPGTVDGRFYLHLGDSLMRLDRVKEAREIFQEGEDKKLFRSAWQRSLYNVDSLTGRPWWTPKQTGYEKYLKLLEDNWKTIRDEGLAQLNSKTGSFIPEEEKLRDTGDWKQFTLYQQGKKKTENCAKVPKTCALIDQIPDASGCKRGQVKFSVMSPGIHVWPHVGPTNCRIRAHLGLVVPEGPIIRVVNETRTWKEGKFIIFDDSFEHEVWHEGSELRLVLIVDFWHPELSAAQKRRLSAI